MVPSCGNNMGCVYKLTSPNRKSYVGVTKKTAEERWEKHKEHALGKRDAGALYSALRKYGPNTFTLEVLCVCSDWDRLLALEKRLIAFYQTLTPSGYNISEGGQGGSWIPTDKFRASCSAGQKKRFARPDQRALLLAYGSKARRVVIEKAEIRRKERRAKQKTYLSSQEFKTLHSEATKRAMRSPEVKAKIIACAKARAADPEWRKKISRSKTGTTHATTPEWCNHIAEARKKQWADPVWKAQHLLKCAATRAAKQHS